MIDKLNKNLAYFVKVIVFAVFYHLAARVGLLMAYVQANTSPVWPPTGIAFAVLVLAGVRYWPGITLGVFFGSLITNTPVTVAFGMAFGNTLEAVIGVMLLQKLFTFHTSLDRLSDVIGLVIIAFVATTISATVGASTLVFTAMARNSEFFRLWVIWWIGDLLGALVVAPVILVWLKPLSFKNKQKKVFEAASLFLATILLTWYVFSKKTPMDVTHQAMIYVIFPFVIWAAIRFAQHGATASNFLVSAIAIWGTVSGAGPFTQESINDSLILLQTFMGVVSLTSLILAATTIERRHAEQALHHRIEDLDTLNTATKSFLGNFDKQNIYEIICTIALEKFFVDCAWIEMLTPDDSMQSSIVSNIGIDKDAIKNHKIFWRDQGQVGDINSVVLENDAELSPYKSYSIFPLVFGKDTIGALKLLSKSDSVFTQDRQVLIQSYANLSAVAIQNKWLFEEVKRGNEQLHALTQRLMKAQEEERLHLSRELHDESAQLLAVLMMQLGLLERETKGESKISPHLEKINQFTKNLQSNLHRLAVNLRPASLDHLGLVKALEQIIQEFSRQYLIPIDFEAIGLEGKRLPIEIETSLFRIVQESLTNVALHANAKHVDVLITYRNHHVVILVEDDGVGFITRMPTMEKHLGLFGMKERVEMMHGEFAIESAPGKGTTIKVEVPIDG